MGCYQNPNCFPRLLGNIIVLSFAISACSFVLLNHVKSSFLLLTFLFFLVVEGCSFLCYKNIRQTVDDLLQNITGESKLKH